MGTAAGAGGAGAPVSTSPHAASMLGGVGLTTVAVSAADKASGKFNSNANAGTGEIGEDIYGPFEAGFGATQRNILLGLGCTDANVESSYIDGGIDTSTAEKMTATTCGVELPRCVRVTASVGDALRGARRASAGWVGSWCPVLRWRWWRCTRCGGY